MIHIISRIFLFIVLVLCVTTTYLIGPNKSSAYATPIETDFVSIVKSLEDIPYQKNSADKISGFDSAGFLYYSYALLGYHIPRTLVGQVSSTFTTISSLTQVTVGDALYFGNSQSPGFAAIYIGDNQAVMSSLKSDKVVIVTLTNIIQKKFILAKRILNLNDIKKAQLVLTAEKYLGIPYVFGAKIGQTQTFDCSSFIKTVFAENAYTLPRISKQQAKAGVFISRNNLQVGDLLFFTTKASGKAIGHVGMYVGKGMMIHTYGEGGVKYASMETGWWKNHYVTARRIL